MTRREFLRLAALGVPAFNIGSLSAAPLAKRISQGQKIRVAVIGCGGRMQQLVEPIMEEQVVALVDPDPKMRMSTLGKMKKIPTVGDLSNVRQFNDYRELYAKMGEEIDAVFIGTPNHHHALAAVLAMRLGIHVFVEKPMASTVEEAQLMGRVARETGVVTQVGNFGHSTKAMRICVDSIQKGLIGEIRDVWCYDDRLNSMMHRPKSAPVPAGIDWDSWCGPAPVCDYYAPNEDHQGLHPHDWHSWIGYGNGSIGNMGTHIMDAAFWSLELGKVHPETIITHEAEFACPGAWAWRDTIDFEFPARGSLPPVTLHWYDGVCPGIPYDKSHVDRYGHALRREWLNLPPILLETEKKWDIADKAPFLNMGTLFCGTRGTIWFSHHSAIRFFPKTLGREIKKSKTFTYKTTEHTHEFYAAIREKRPANTGFDYSVPLAETLLLANVAARTGKGSVLKWDGNAITNNSAANAFLKTTYRPGWEIRA